MKQRLIIPEDLLKFMSKENYSYFLDELRNKGKIPREEPIWIIAEWSNNE